MADDKASRLAVALNGYGRTVAAGGVSRRTVLPWGDLVEIVDTAERTGYEAVFVPEIGAREAFGTLAGFSAVTERIRLATGVVRIDRRDRKTTALAAATLHDISGGRFVLGLGSSLPIDGTRVFLRAVRSLLAGEDGDLAADAIDLPAERVPLFLAALGPRMAELAGEAAEGVLLNWCTPERVARAREEVARGAERAGRDPGEVTVAVYVRACVGPADEHSLAVLKEAATQYAAMPTYRRQFEAMGLGQEARAAAAGEPPESLLRRVCVWGTSRDEAVERLDAYREAGAGLVVVYPVPALESVSSILGTILAAAPRPAAAA